MIPRRITRMSRKIGCILATLLVLPLVAQRPPPPACPNPTILPSQVAVTYQGLVSGCTEQVGACIVGETVVFTSKTTYQCVLEHTWQFPEGPVFGGATVNHIFATPGTFTITLTATGASNSLIISKAVTVAPASSIPILSTVSILLLLSALALVAVRRLT